MPKNDATITPKNDDATVKDAFRVFFKNLKYHGINSKYDFHDF